jgi:hypothetical protein
MIAPPQQRQGTNNHLLRRVDWRFLLPSPHPARSISFTDGVLAEAVAAISKTTVAVGQHAPAECDLAVAVDPDDATLAAAWSALHPGGSCYVEWYSPCAGGVSGVRRRMQAAGFEAVTAYWPWPWPDRQPPSFWLPLEAAGALHYFLDKRNLVQPVRQRMQTALLRWLWRLSRRLELTLPICVVARKPESAGGEALMPQQALLERVKANWENWGLGPTPHRLSWLLLTGGQRPINKVVGLVFAEPHAQPRIAVKLARVPESISALAHEAAVLGSLHASRPGGVDGVPRLLFYEGADGAADGVADDVASQTLLGETVLTGAPLYAHLRRESFRDLALQATAWLADLAGEPPLPAHCLWWEQLAEPALNEFTGSFGAAVDPALIERTRSLLAGVGALPVVCEQRDFSPWNVLIAPDGEWVVLDWESAELQGLPGLDLLYFLTYLTFFVDGAMQSGRRLESYRAMLDPTTFTGAVFAECWTTYAHRLGLDPDALGPLRLLAWMIHARSEYRQFLGESGGHPTPEQLQSSLFMSLWQEEISRDDFDGR